MVVMMVAVVVTMMMVVMAAPAPILVLVRCGHRALSGVGHACGSC
jgi:hypothetical protein